MKANPDLWAAYRKLVGYRKQAPKFIWVQGHAGHQHNERADQLAGLGAWNNDLAAYEKWQASQAPEARAGISAAQLATLKLQIQQLQTFCEGVANESGRVNLQERKFIEDMAKKMQKNRFAPTEKQQNWVTVLVKKYRIR
jgi:hypothetical protein